MIFGGAAGRDSLGLHRDRLGIYFIDFVSRHPKTRMVRSALVRKEACSFSDGAKKGDPESTRQHELTKIRIAEIRFDLETSGEEALLFRNVGNGEH